jgi:hypothetical protein
MATASGDGEDRRRPVMSFVAYAILVALLGSAGVALWTGAVWTGAVWTGEWAGFPGAPRSDRTFPAVSKAPPLDLVHAQGLSLPPRPAEPEATALTRQEPARAPAALSSPSQSEAGNSNLAAAAAEKPEPRKTTCTVDVSPWPVDRTDQAKAIQILLRDLGFYSGTTYGTVGPATRAAIRKFQLAADETETGEPSEILFESLKKKCASSAP